jgi:hypothetical protein
MNVMTAIIAHVTLEVVPIRLVRSSIASILSASGQMLRDDKPQCHLYENERSSSAAE